MRLCGDRFANGQADAASIAVYRIGFRRSNRFTWNISKPVNMAALSTWRISLGHVIAAIDTKEPTSAALIRTPKQSSFCFIRDETYGKNISCCKEFAYVDLPPSAGQRYGCFR
jgi:hypothetical protein